MIPAAIDEDENERIIAELEKLDTLRRPLTPEDERLALQMSLLICQFEESRYSIGHAEPVEALRVLMESRGSVKVNGEALTVDLADGRTIIVPLVWFPRLWHGTPRERSHFEIFGEGRYIHWPDLDEDLTVAGLLAGRQSGESLESLGKWLDSRKVAGSRRGSRPAHPPRWNTKRR